MGWDQPGILFYCVDHVGYRAGNKLPHKITSLIGVMDAASSDRRSGLYHQVVEILEPMRILFLIETTATAMKRIIAENEAIQLLWEGNWVQLAILFRNKLCKVGLNERRNVVLDMFNTALVDHSVMEKLHEMQSDFSDAGLDWKVAGMEGHAGLSSHAYGARILDKLRRATVVLPPEVAEIY